MVVGFTTTYAILNIENANTKCMRKMRIEIIICVCLLDGVQV
jgi:hypothetical protein